VRTNDISRLQQISFQTVIENNDFLFAFLEEAILSNCSTKLLDVFFNEIEDILIKEKLPQSYVGKLIIMPEIENCHDMLRKVIVKCFDKDLSIILTLCERATKKTITLFDQFHFEFSSQVCYVMF